MAHPKLPDANARPQRASGRPGRLRVERRETSSRTLQWVMPLASVAIALLLGVIPLLLRGVNPLEAYAKLFEGALGSLNALAKVAVKMTPLLLTGLAVAIPLRAGLWNIGAEGQLHMGAVGATWVALSFLGADASPWVVIPLMCAAGALLAGAYAFLPALLRAKFSTNEIITTLMLNYVALYIVQLLITGPWRDSSGFPRSESFGTSAFFPEFFGTRIHLGLPIALGVALLIYFIYVKTRIGFETKVVGANPQAAALGGINQTKVTLWTLMLGGAIAGLAGVGEVAATQHRLIEGISPLFNPYGYTGIAVALLAKGHPLGLLPSSFALAALFVGGESIKTFKFVSLFTGVGVQVPVAIVLILQVLIIVSIVGGDYLSRYRIAWRRHG